MDKTVEADKLLKKGKKYLSPSILEMRLKPDWEAAAPLIERAALLYKVSLGGSAIHALHARPQHVCRKLAEGSPYGIITCRCCSKRVTWRSHAHHMSLLHQLKKRWVPHGMLRNTWRQLLSCAGKCRHSANQHICVPSSQEVALHTAEPLTNPWAQRC